ncbi:MAG TPA: AMP-binding protein [Thermoleophilaceae bacterium]
MTLPVSLALGLHEHVRRHAEATPGSRALAWPSGAATYAELDRAAAAYAAELRRFGIAGRFVPVVLEPTVERVAALLAVLRLGGAYAALDPAWPERRLRDAVRQLDPPVAVGVLPVEGAPSTWRPPPFEDVAGEVGTETTAWAATDPCCVFFTSGTTGRPKGVVVSHQAIARLLVPGSFADFGPGTAILQAAPLWWDAGAFELWGALATGGTAVLSPEARLTPRDLARRVAGEGVNTLWLTASLFNVFVDEEPGAFAGTDLVVTGGERLSVPHIRHFLDAHPEITLVNGYGPVESTVFATTHRVEPRDCDRPHGIPIGRPVPHTDVLVLDGDRSCGPGERGELCIAGPGVALGYLIPPADERLGFVEPGGDAPRIYRTGDLGLRDDDGILHYLGRTDRQVKVRGHRLEPAGIERIVAEVEGVRHVAVVPRRDAAGRVVELLAFYTTRDGRPEPAVRAHAETLLPKDQLPAAFVHLERMPLTSNGKLDDDALLAAHERGAPPAHGVAGSGSVALVADVFAEVLGHPAVPPAAAFADLGGSSLDAIRACARLEDRLGVPVPVSVLLECGTAEALARHLDARRDRASAYGRATAGGRVPLTPVQTAFLLDALLELGDTSGHCVLAWELRGDLDRDALELALGDVQDRHEALRSRYGVGDEPVALPFDRPPPALEETGPAHSVEAAAAAAIELLGRPLDIVAGAVWRAVLATSAGGSAVLGIVVSHIAFDGWSESVLARDLSTAYRARSAGGTPRFARPAPTLAELAHAERARLDSVDLTRQRAYWREELRGLKALELPEARSPARRPERRVLTIAGRDVRALRGRPREPGVSPLGRLVAAHAEAVSAATGATDFGIGVPVARRAGPELETAIGCLIGMLCLRGRPRGGGTPDSLERSAESIRAALRMQDLPLDELVRIVNPDRGRRWALYQTILTLQNQPPSALDLDGVETRRLDVPHIGIPTDLLAEVWSGPADELRIAITGHLGDLVDRVAAAYGVALAVEPVGGGAGAGTAGGIAAR